MTTTINASTTSGLIVSPDNSGNIQLLYNGVAAPAFSAYLSANQSVSANVLTKITFDTEDFDTANCFASNRFTPTVAGYYQFNACLCTTTSPTASIRFYKNGLQYCMGNDINASTNAAGGSALIYLNGTTDYVEVYGVVGSGGFFGHVADSSYPRYTFFNGLLVRGA